MQGFIIFVVFCSFLTLGVMKLVNSRRPNWSNLRKVLIAGIAPSVLLILFLIAAHLYLVAEYRRDPIDGFMSPLLILVMGYPIVLINLAANFGIAYSLRVKQ